MAAPIVHFQLRALIYTSLVLWFTASVTNVHLKWSQVSRTHCPEFLVRRCTGLTRSVDSAQEGDMEEIAKLDVHRHLSVLCCASCVEKNTPPVWHCVGVVDVDRVHAGSNVVGLGVHVWLLLHRSPSVVDVRDDRVHRRLMVGPQSRSTDALARFLLAKRRC